MSLYKEYIKTDKENIEIKLSINFNKDTCNWATGQSKNKGYYVTVVPVEISRTGNVVMESFGAFTGFNKCLLETDRQSPKRFNTALQLLQEQKKELIELLNKNLIN